MTAISSKHYSAGEVIEVCEPFVHTLSQQYKAKYCDNCVVINQSLKKCSKCETMFYCDRKCQSSDWKYHKLECHLIARHQQLIQTFVKESHDHQYMLLLRLILMLNKDPSLATRCSSFSGSFRCLNDLLSHEQQMKHYIDSDPNTYRFLSLIVSFGINISFDQFRRIYGQVLNNTISLFGADIHQSEIGCGVYIPISVFNHSCEPNANFLNYGKQIKIRAMKSIEPLEEVFVSYIPVDRPKSDRQQLLNASKCFLCLCVRCSSDFDRNYDYKLLEQLCKEQNKISNELRHYRRNEFKSLEHELGMNRIIKLGEQIIALKKPLYRYYSHNIGCDMFVHSLNLLDAINYGLCGQTRRKVIPFIQLTAEYLKITHGSEHQLYQSFARIANSSRIQVYNVSVPSRANTSSVSEVKQVSSDESDKFTKFKRLVLLTKPTALLFDLAETVIKTGFIDKLLIRYIRNNIRQYVTEMWLNETLQKDIERMRKVQAMVILLCRPVIASRNDSVVLQQNSVCDYVLWHIENRLDHNRSIRIFKFNMWFDAYDNNKLETPVYSDVATQLRFWKSKNIQLFVMSNGWSEITKKFMTKTSHGNLECIIDQFFDPTTGSLSIASTYRSVCELIGHSAAKAVFLTKDPSKAKAAKEAGITPVLVMTHRKNFNHLTLQDRTNFRIIRTFLDLSFV